MNVICPFAQIAFQFGHRIVIQFIFGIFTIRIIILHEMFIVSHCFFFNYFVRFVVVVCEVEEQKTNQIKNNLLKVYWLFFVCL